MALTTEEARKLLLRRLPDVDEEGNSRNPRGDAESSPQKAAEQVGSLREAQVGLETVKASEGVSATPEANSDALGLDWVTAKLKAKPQPPGDDFADRLCAPYIVRAARDLGLVIGLEIENCIGISGQPKSGEKTAA